MALSESEREAVRQKFVQILSRERDLLPLTKPDILAAVDATDDWIEANQAAFNAALPTAARTAMSAGQKALMFSYVALRRFEVI